MLESLKTQGKIRTDKILIWKRLIYLIPRSKHLHNGPI
jgi:hypothetical protein